MAAAAEGDEGSGVCDWLQPSNGMREWDGMFGQNGWPPPPNGMSEWGGMSVAATVYEMIPRRGCSHGWDVEMGWFGRHLLLRRPTGSPSMSGAGLIRRRPWPDAALRESS